MKAFGNFFSGTIGVIAAILLCNVVALGCIGAVILVPIVIGAIAGTPTP